jgi:hypothetical protein
VVRDDDEMPGVDTDCREQGTLQFKIIHVVIQLTDNDIS